MKVRRSSWHFRLWLWGRDSQRSVPVDLCRYFWHILLVKILLPIALVVGLVAGLAGLVWVSWTHFDVFLAIVGILAATAAFVGVFAYGGHLYDKRKKRLDLGPRRPPKEPSLVRSYLSARKRKVCPLIQVVDDREGS